MTARGFPTVRGVGLAAALAALSGCSRTVAPAVPVARAELEPSAPPSAVPPTPGPPREPPPKKTSATPDVAEAATPMDESELPAGTTILQIGDSFAGALGIDLNRDLKEEGVRGVLKYEQSTYIPTWASNKDLDGYLNRFHPDLVLITLGANELSIPDPAQRAPTIHRLVGRLGGRACVWVAPPLWEGARPALLDTIRESCAPCVYLDSSALVPDLQRMRDHIHPSMQGRKIWAKAVLDWLREHRDPHGSRPWEMKP
ncbi:MAG TPA: hypothetical protein VHU80_19895 [Polyangiaceae bacterium]|nr:hypothetical protein [Polyangiaceae bacterium]